MKMKTKYKAFTITETVFGLIISSVLIGVIYTVFTAFNKQFYQFKQQQEQANTYFIFDSTFRADLYKATDIYFENETVFLTDYNGIIASYTFKGNDVSRTYNEHTETILYNVEKYAFQTNENYNSIQLEFKLHKEIIKHIYQKKKDPAKSINNTFIYEN